MMLDMSKLKKANDAMCDVRVWTLDTVFETVAKVSFCLWDYRFPKNFETIMIKLMDKFKSRYEGDGYKSTYIKFIATYLINVSGNDLVQIISDILRSIPEFMEWNESDDSGFFIDLYAFNQNVFCALRSEIVMSEYFEVNGDDL